MTANKEMISDFLKESRTAKLSSDKRSKTITWDCTPGKVFYNYAIPGGSTQRKGYYNHKGIYRYNNGTYKKGNKRYNLFEGVKCVKIQYRKNNGTWSTVSDPKGIASSELKRTFTSSKNGDKYEIKATYQVWTMGSPFREVPFVWFGTLNGTYNEGANKFSQSSPANPGRGWSGMSNYTQNKNSGTDKNSSWKIVNYSWYQPNSSSNNTNWTYLHAKDYYESKKTSSNGWLSKYACEKWLKGMPYKDHNMDGWTGNVSGTAPQKTRKSTWWTFEKVFTDTYTVSGVSDKPDPLSDPTVSLNVINNLSVKDNVGRLNGIEGSLQITYKQSNGVSGTYKIWGQQRMGTEYIGNVVASGSIKNNETKTIKVKFGDVTGFKRGKTIVYYAEVYTNDSEYNTTRTGKSSTNKNWNDLLKSGSHYYNDEPKYSSSFTAEKKGTTMKLKWNSCKDPDGHDIAYYIYVLENNKNGSSVAGFKSSDHNPIRVKKGTSYETKTILCSKMYKTTNTSYDLDISKYGDSVLDIYLVPADKYYNDYYYGNSLEERMGPDAEVLLTVIDNMTNKDSSGKICGDHGSITLKYTNRKGVAADIDIYAYMANDKLSKTCSGKFIKKVATISNMAHNTTKSILVDFNSHPELKRGYYIKYFALAKDKNGNYSALPTNYNSNEMWWNATGFHYYNSLPTPVSPFLTESNLTVFNDNKVEIAWPKSVDLEGHEIYYRLYIQVENNTPYTDTFYINNENNPMTLKYTKYIELGSSILPTNNNPYVFNISEYIGKKICIWIKTCDAYNANKYLTGALLDIGSPSVSLDIPKVKVEYAYAKNFYGVDGIDSESGHVSVSYTHPVGRSGSVYLHAICKRYDGQMKAFKNIAEFQLNSGEWSPKTRINFPEIFTNEWRGSEVRYYATAKSYMGEWSVPEKSEWYPSISMWDSWIGYNKFNEQPYGVPITINHDKCDLHNNIYIEWPKAIDIDVDAITYTILVAVKSNLTSNLPIRYRRSGEEHNEIIPYTWMWDTQNTHENIDISSYNEDDEFTIYVIPRNECPNSYYYMDNPLIVGKTRYGKPKVSVDLTQTHSESGNLKIKYEHEDLTYSNGSYISNNPHRSVANGDFNGKISVYCYVDDKYSYSYSIKDKLFVPGQEETFVINFEDLCPYSRSHNIRYFIVAEDLYTGVKNTDIDPKNAQPKDLTIDSHYYNDEPYDPIISVGTALNEEDKLIYGFEYTNIVWDRPFEPDGDNCMYYVYIKIPTGLQETVKNVALTNREYNLTNFEYTRKYRITETYNSEANKYSCKVEYLNDNNQYVLLQNNPFIGIRIDYNKDHLDKEWPENDQYSVMVEARDTRQNLDNSYYGISNKLDLIRKRHLPPNEVKIDVTYNLTDGTSNGERGTMTVVYTHPEENIEGKVSIYAYQDNTPVANIYTGDFKNGESRVIEYNFTDFTSLNRSKYITYYAVAIDKLFGMSSLDRIFENENAQLSNETKLSFIPYLTPNVEGKYGVFQININGTYYDYNENNEYKGPVRKGLHYYNEEPPSTTPKLVDNDLIAYKYAEIKWPHVKDPDNHDVSYELYIAASGPDDYLNTNYDDFYNDDIPNPNDTLLEEESEASNAITTIENVKAAASGHLKYHKVVSIPASLAEEASKDFSLSVEEYDEDTIINTWIVSKDQYVNSYYRAGNILSISKGHKARDIRAIYPRNGSTVYATCPRILIYLGEDNQVQTTYVGWREKEYNNKDNPEMFSSLPNNKNVIVFKPPVPYTTLSGTKVSYYVYSHNKCSFSDKKYATYTYKDFFEPFTDDKFIALKSDHINLFRNAINVTRDAYGLSTIKYSRNIQKGMMFENYDFNETKHAICEVNDLLNNIDNTNNLDYINPLIIDVNDLDVVEYEGTIGTTSYNEFLEWARLVYILQNL